MAAEEKGDLDALKAKGERYKKADGGYTRADVDVKVTDTSVDGRSATVKLTEHTRLYLPFSPEEVADGAPEYEELSLPHTITYRQGDDGSWLLAADKADDEGGPTPTTQVGDSEPETADDGGGKPDEDEGHNDESSETAPLPATDAAVNYVKPEVSAAGYNYNKMVAYANKYWDHHNDAYRTYGTDCTNFISQAMLAGGWEPAGGSLIQRTSNKYWFYGPAQIFTSYTWAAAENWYWFAKKHSHRTKILDNVWKLALADVLQADWNRSSDNIDHSMIVTRKYRGTPYLTYHSGDTHNKSLTKLLSDHPSSRTTWYAHRT